MVYWIYRDAIGEWRWYLKYENRNKIADSGEGYKSKADCEHGINLVKGSTDAPVYSVDGE
jgi:uncharacterized protein